MERLFADGQGQLVATVTSWLSSDHVTLQAAGALAVANFARKCTCGDMLHYDSSMCASNIEINRMRLLRSMCT